MAVLPFRFSGLAQFTREQIALQETMATYMTSAAFRPRFRHNLADTLSGYLKTPIEISAAETRALAASALVGLVPKTPCLVQVGMGASAHKILVDIEPVLVAFTIERLLGGTGDADKMSRPLTDIEEGVFSFVVLQVLRAFHTEWETGRELGLTLDRIESSLEPFRDMMAAEANYQIISVNIAAGRRTGYVRIMVPETIVRSTMTQASAGVPTPRELAYRRRVLHSLGDQEVLARLEITTLSLMSDDIANLEPGDIIVLENHQLELSPDGITGRVFVRLGLGKNGGFFARALAASDHAKLQVLEIVLQEEPSEGAVSGDEFEDSDVGMDDADAASDNLEETHGLLRDVEAPVIVELGRINMTTAQVVRLRGGQILRLNRGPNDPVDLVVNDKLFARGELVDVDGELGVRLIHVVGAG